MENLIITGCNGQLGRALNQLYIGNADYNLINTDVGELDITDIDAVVSFVKEYKPYAIINCAAHTAVDKCETDVDNAYRINAVGPRNLAIAAAQNNAKLVHISTDYVFSGDQGFPYTEDDATNPQGVYGKSKLQGEHYVKQFCAQSFILRTAWLYGEGKNFVKTMLALSETKDEVSVVKDQIGSPTSALELARAILQLLPTQNYGLFHATCEGVCSWADFAEEIFKLAGKSTKVNPITTDLFPTPAKRPAYSVLENRMFKLTSTISFKDWREALAEYMGR